MEMQRCCGWSRSKKYLEKEKQELNIEMPKKYELTDLAKINVRT